MSALSHFTKEETTFVFDWDDTLLSSYWLTTKGFRTTKLAPITREMIDGCIDLSNAAASILEKAKSLGNVIIITNSSEGWVQLSCKMFMPNVLPILEGIPIISAQEKYKKQTSQPVMWKHHTFVDQMKESFVREPGLKRNIISIGDGPPELEAMRSIRLFYSYMHGCDKTFTKCIKLIEKSSPEDLINQLEKITNGLEYLTQQSINMDLMIMPSRSAFGGEKETREVSLPQIPQASAPSRMASLLCPTRRINPISSTFLSGSAVLPLLDQTPSPTPQE